MTARDLIDAFETMADAPNGVEKLRDLVLALAVQGRLVPQDPSEDDACELLGSLTAKRDALVDGGVILKPRSVPNSPVSVEPFEIPESWEWAFLGQVGAIVGGGTPKSKVSEYWADDGVPWLTPADMRSQSTRYVSRGSRDISDEGLSSSSARLVPEGTVLFSSRAPIGHVGIAANPLSTNQGFKSCVPYEPGMSEFIYLFLWQQGPAINASATGTTFKEVSGKQVAAIPIPVPPLAEQHRIVAKVDELMSLLDRLEAARDSKDTTRASLRDAALQALQDAEDAEEVQAAWSRISENMDELFADPADVEPLRQTVLQLAVRGRLVPQDPEDEEAGILLDKAYSRKAYLVKAKAIRKPKTLETLNEDDLPFALPAGWEWSQLNSLVYALGDGPHFSPKYVDETSGVPFLSARNVTVRGYSPVNMKYVSRADHEEFCRKIRPEPGDVLYTKGGTTGVAMVNHLDFEFSVWVHVAVLKVAKEYFDPNYVALALNSPLCYHQSQLYTHGTGNRDLGLTRMIKIKIPVPPREEQKRIVMKAKELMSLCDAFEDRLVRIHSVESAYATRASSSMAS